MTTTNQSKIVPNKVLVTGASGLLGVADAGWLSGAPGGGGARPRLDSGVLLTLQTRFGHSCF
jgi:hypothetical protein